ncbi:hypothetical protein, partial [Streptacidiphilus monticola]
MIGVVPVLLAGGAVGAGVVMAVAGLSRGRPDVADVLARMDAGRLATIAPRHETAAGVSVLDRIGAKALAQFGEQALRIPRRELDILRESPARFVGRKVALALYGLALPTIAVALLALAGVQVPFAIPGFAALVAAGVFWFVPDLNVRGRAKEARIEFRVAVASYLELVSLERAADAGPTEALKRAAAVGDGWVFERIRDALQRSELGGIAPWEVSAYAFSCSAPYG